MAIFGFGGKDSSHSCLAWQLPTLLLLLPRWGARKPTLSVLSPQLSPTTSPLHSWRICRPHPLAGLFLQSWENVEINNVSIRQTSKVWGGGGRGLRLCPSPGMPEKAPGASGSLQRWRLPTDSFLGCTDQAWRGAWEPSFIPTPRSTLGCPPAAGGPGLPPPTHKQKKGGGGGPCSCVPLSSSIPSQSRRQAPQSVDLDPSAVAALQKEQRQFSPLTVETQHLIYSILSLERAMRGRSYFFPHVKGRGERSRFCSREETGWEEAQIFLETWELLSKQGPSGAGNDFVLISILKRKCVVESIEPGAERERGRIGLR